jgi:chromosome segregation ATPase
MMKNLTGKFATILAALILVPSFLSFTYSANAQTKKKTTKRQTKTSSIPKPVSTQTLPVVISQADQYQNQNQQIIGGNTENTTQTLTETVTQPETLDEKMDKMNNRLREANTRIKSLESNKQSAYDEKQKRLLMNLDILTRSEQRAESLRKQMFDLVEKENSIKTKLETIDFDIRPDMIDRQVSMAGSLRPEELREMRRKNLEAEKRNLESLLTEVQTTRANLEQNVQKADQLVEKLRVILEKDIDNALSEEPKDQ